MRKSLNTNIDFILYEKGTDFLLDGTTQRGLFVEAIEKITYYNDIIMTTNFPFETGSLVNYQDSDWLIISEINHNNDQDMSIYKARMRKCSNILILNVNGILHKVPCLVTDKVALGLDINTYISTLDTQIYIMVANDAFTSNIKLNDIYKIGRLNYSVQNIDDLTKPGLLNIKLKFSEVPQVLPVYSIQILNGESTTTNIDIPIQLNIKIMDGDTILTEPLPVVYSSSDEAIATIDALGYVIPVSVGSCIITVALESDTTISDSLSLVVEEVPILDNKTVIVSGDIEIIKGYSKNYTCSFQNNGIPYSDNSIFYIKADDGVSATTLATITSQNGITNTCTIYGNNLGYVKLFVKNESETLISEGFRIRVKSLF